MSIYRTFFDFGILILIWLVQLIIYPSFTYMNERKFSTWHKKYTLLISFFVIPLMLGQGIILLGQFIFNFSYLTIFSIALVAVAWISTLLQAIPLHNEMEKSVESELYRKQLIKINWLRTFAWTLVFILGLIEY
jgi:hypothetical protein